MGDVAIALLRSTYSLSIRVRKTVSSHWGAFDHDDDADKETLSNIQECCQCMARVRSQTTVSVALALSHTPANLRALWAWLASACGVVPINGLRLALLIESVALFYKMGLAIRDTDKRIATSVMPAGSQTR